MNTAPAKNQSREKAQLHFEASLERDIERIKSKIMHMAALGEQGLRNAVRALREKNRQLAYTVILRDLKVDELEKEVDRLCLEFLVRQQPVAGPLRFAYATIRINLELERVGDYAESISRQVLKLTSQDVEAVPLERFEEMAEHSIPMLSNAVKAFLHQDEALARSTMEVEKVVDALKSKLIRDLIALARADKLTFEALNSLMMIARHIERVSDQAKNISTEVLYMCTGADMRHKESEVIKVLFVDVHNSCRSQMAEAIGQSLGQRFFVFHSAGLAPSNIDPRTVEFLKGKQLSVAAQKSKPVPPLEEYQIVIALAKEAETIFPNPRGKTICLDWSTIDPSKVKGTEAEITAAYEATFKFLQEHITDLVEAVMDET